VAGGAMGPRRHPVEDPAVYRYACEREFYRVVGEDPSCKERASTDLIVAARIERACATRF
jgi:hypothetical protein